MCVNSPIKCDVKQETIENFKCAQRGRAVGKLIISPPPCLFSVKARGKNGKITHGAAAAERASSPAHWITKKLCFPIRALK